MKLDLRPLLRGELREIPINFFLSAEPVKNAQFDGDAHITGKITDSAGYMRLVLHSVLHYKSQCDRCLCDVNGELSIDFERTVVAEDTLSDEQLQENVDEYVVLKDGFLNVDDELREAIILEFPSKILCNKNCPGLCPKCGKLLKNGDCGCTQKEVDPRLAVLADYFKNNKE